MLNQGWLDPTLRVSDSVDLGWGPRTGISDKVTVDAVGVSLVTTL